VTILGFQSLQRLYLTAVSETFDMAAQGPSTLFSLAADKSTARATSILWVPAAILANEVRWPGLFRFGLSVLPGAESDPVSREEQHAAVLRCPRWISSAPPARRTWGPIGRAARMACSTGLAWFSFDKQRRVAFAWRACTRNSKRRGSSGDQTGCRSSYLSGQSALLRRRTPMPDITRPRATPRADTAITHRCT